MTPDDVLDLLGIEISPARLKCALLSLDTVSHALEERTTGADAAAPPDPATADPATAGSATADSAPAEA